MDTMPWKGKVERLRQRLHAQTSKTDGHLSSERQTTAVDSSSTFIYDKLKDYMELTPNTTTSSTSFALTKSINLSNWTLDTEKDNNPRGGKSSSRNPTAISRNGQEKRLDGLSIASSSLVGVADSLFQQVPAESVIRIIDYDKYGKYGETDFLSSSSSGTTKTFSHLSLKSYLTPESVCNTTTMDATTDYGSLNTDTLTVDLTFDTHGDAKSTNHDDGGDREGLPMSYGLGSSGGGDCAIINVKHGNHDAHKSQSPHNATNESALIDNGKQLKELAQHSLNSIKSEIKVLEGLLAHE